MTNDTFHTEAEPRKNGPVDPGTGVADPGDEATV